MPLTTTSQVPCLWHLCSHPWHVNSHWCSQSVFPSMACVVPSVACVLPSMASVFLPMACVFPSMACELPSVACVLLSVAYVISMWPCFHGADLLAVFPWYLFCRDRTHELLGCQEGQAKPPGASSDSLSIRVWSLYSSDKGVTKSCLRN